MAKNNYKDVVKSQASKLDKAVAFLKPTLGEVAWLYHLTTAASSIRENCKGDDWSIQITDMELPIETPRHLKPHELKGNLKMFVSISMKGSGKEWKECKDCIKRLRFNVVVLEKNQRDKQKYYQTGFHIDRVDENDDSSEMHPLYHVHYFNDSKIYGSETMNMDVPRLMHHPVDVFLGILLVYANFNSAGYNKLLQNGNFMSLCHDSAKHILAPYFMSLYKITSDEGSVTEYDKSLCPYLTI